jgi:hypothetical protein
VGREWLEQEFTPFLEGDDRGYFVIEADACWKGRPSRLTS